MSDLEIIERAMRHAPPDLEYVKAREALERMQAVVEAAQALARCAEAQALTIALSNLAQDERPIGGIHGNAAFLKSHHIEPTSNPEETG